MPLSGISLALSLFISSLQHNLLLMIFLEEIGLQRIIDIEVHNPLLDF